MFFNHPDPWFLYLCASACIAVTLIFVTIGNRKGWLHRESARKILHLVAVMSCAFVVYKTDGMTELAMIFFGFSVLLFYIAQRNILIPSPRKSYGIALFPLAFAWLLLLPLPSESILFAMITLGVSDAVAGVTGTYFARKKYIFLYEEKSPEGFVAFLISTMIIGYFFIGWTPLLFVLALVPALCELFSYRGSDNLTVPLVSAVWFYIVGMSDYTTLNWGSFFVVLPFLIFVYRKQWLSVNGSVAALLLATTIIFSAGPLFLFPIGFFFIAGSLSSRLHSGSSDASGRNVFQVFANGLVFVICVVMYVLTENDIFLSASMVSVAVSLADTMSSDIGIYFKQKTYDIISWQPVRPGLSGGISWSGSLAGIIGSCIFALVLSLMFDFDHKTVILISMGGVAGMVLDSVLGSLIQAKYSYNNELTEDKTVTSDLIKGFSWMDNDGVNFLSNVLVTLLFLISIME